MAIHYVGKMEENISRFSILFNKLCYIYIYMQYLLTEVLIWKQPARAIYIYIHLVLPISLFLTQNNYFISLKLHIQ